MAMQEELNNLERNQVWTLVERPKINVLGTKWVFRNKQDENGEVTRNKARLVAQSFAQVVGLDFKETYALVAMLEAIRMLLVFDAHHDFKPKRCQECISQRPNIRFGLCGVATGF